MAVINLRKDKERPLTIEEVDNNFESLNNELSEKLNESLFTAEEILTRLEPVPGASSTIDAKKLQGFLPNRQTSPNTVAVRDSLSNLYANQFHGTHIGAVLGNVTGNVIGTVTGNATNIDGIVQIEHGGTGATTAPNARNALGLGNMATQNKGTVDITGGSIVGIDDLAVADGGTGASNASGARSNLGLVIGSDVQAYDAILSGLSTTTGEGFLIRTSTDSAVVRKFTEGNSIEITNGTGVGGDLQIGVTTNPVFTSITKTGTNGTGDIGQTGNRFGTVWARASTAAYADLAEKYTTDVEYEPGTVIVVAEGGSSEATQSFKHDQRVLGVVSTNPAYVMNDESTGQAIALVGRVPVKVVGPIRKGQPIVCTPDGKAQYGDSIYSFGQALETNLDAGVKLVECVIK